MEEKKKGGSRKGAGRKPSSNPKETISLYVEKSFMWPFGGKEKMKEAIYEFIKSKQGEPKVYDAPKFKEPITHDEPLQWEAPRTNRRRTVVELTQAKTECLTPEDWAVLVEEIKRTPMREYEKNALLRPL